MAGSGEVVTYGELEARSNRLAQFFRDVGLKPGDGIAVLVENHPRFLEVAWAAQRSGLYYTPLSTRLKPEEAAFVLNDCGARVLVTSATLAGTAGPLVEMTPAIDRRLMLDGVTGGHEAYEAVVEKHPDEPIADESEGADMLYSSGTTGRPKGVRPGLTGAPVPTPSALVGLVQQMYGMGAETVYLSPAPLYHAAPLRFSMAVHRLGGTVVVMERFDAQAALAAIEHHRVTHAQFVPTMFIRLLRLPEPVRRRFDRSSLRVVIHAAAPCPVAVKEQMIEWWGPIIHEYYAGTEGNGLCAISSTEWLQHRGSVGRALLGQLHILDENGRELPSGETGTVYFAGGPPFEYHNDPDKTASAHSEAGWSTLGDIGHLDDDGYLYLTDRRSHMIISGGVNIYPQEAENVLALHPAVADVAVFGIPHDEWGEEVKAVVQPADPEAAGPPLVEELLAYCRSRLADYKCPRTIDFEPELPRDQAGKLFKRELQARYQTRGRG
jgi:acyl-CoA synthetase (AMP-forming)/AMP-acid ligase II